MTWASVEKEVFAGLKLKNHSADMCSASRRGPNSSSGLSLLNLLFTSGPCFQLQITSINSSLRPLLKSISISMCLPKLEELFLLSLSLNFWLGWSHTHLVEQRLSASLWLRSLCLQGRLGDQGSLSQRDTKLFSSWCVPLCAETFRYQLVLLTGILLVTAGSRRLLVSLLNFLYVCFFLSMYEIIVLSFPFSNTN